MLAGNAMQTLFIHLASFLALCLFATPALAVPGGELGTLEVGKWYCEIPGDAAKPAEPVPAQTFTAVPDSTYISASGVAGSYLLLGDELVMTTGTLKGQHYRLDSAATLHRLDKDGDEEDLRCVRAGDPAANHPGPAGVPDKVAPTAVRPVT